MIGGLGGPAPQESPSVWRVWIEIDRLEALKDEAYVTLRVEGVD